jgi:biotin carboxyl carrier protein
MKVRVSVQDRLYDVDFEMAGRHDRARQKLKPAPPAIPDRVLRPRQPQRLPEDKVVRSPIAGRVVAILAAPAQQVRRHQGVVLLEAMKMEIPIGPAVDGTLHTIHVAQGDAVTSGQVLFEIVF